MTKKIQVCIGANYGDEGKGRTTAWLAAKSKQKVAVVRFNGGAQAGHTVKSGHYRHVFSHFGSGSFDYVPTILTKDFVCSPYLFMKEHEQLICKGVIRPDVYIDPRCPITTPTLTGPTY
jgi:adenylosuccinate synthase